MHFKKKYKIKIEKIYIIHKELTVNYKTYVKQQPKTQYVLCETGFGTPLKDFILYWFYAKFKHKLYLFF